MTDVDISVSAAGELAQLKDFQQRSARYADKQLWAADGTGRFLVADEVGLGKTHVARGVIALAVERLQRLGDKRVDIVYVTSNAAIAAQNLRKLRIAGVHLHERTQRLALLPFDQMTLDGHAANLIALTPGTSLDARSSTGTFRERAACFAALTSTRSWAELDSAASLRLFYTGITEESGGAKAARARFRAQLAELGPLPTRLRPEFTRILAALDERRSRSGLSSLLVDFRQLVGHYQGTRPNVPREIRARRSQFIADVRQALATLAVSKLHPDLVILDEFQRFKDLLQVDDVSQDQAAQVAQALFTYYQQQEGRSTKVLLLSATPYSMHTTRQDAFTDDRHYDDFLQTYRFLVNGDEGKVADLRHELSRLRTSLLDVGFTGTAPVAAAAAAVSATLIKVMSRIERLASTEDRDGMLVTAQREVGLPTTGSYRQLVGVSRVASELKQQDMVEYWKSAPYPLSFLGGHSYRITREIERSVAEGNDKLQDLLEGNDALVALPAIRRYGRLEPGNPRLESIWCDMLDSSAWRLLWLPPALPNYDGGSDFDTPSAKALTKRLVFSAWAMVPTVVSTLTSYEVERRLVEGSQHRPYDAGSGERHIRRLQWRSAGGRASAMTTVPLVVPSVVLAELGDPLQLGRAAARDGSATLSRVLELARQWIAPAVQPYLEGRPTTAAGEAATWYWLLPSLLDYTQSERPEIPDPVEAATAWWNAEDAVGLQVHLKEMDQTRQRALSGDEIAAGGPLPRVPEDLLDKLALIAVASPANCAYRAFKRNFPQASTPALVGAAAQVAEGFRTLFNSFEATKLLDRVGAEGSYWLRVLEYCAAGNLQAVLDEYVYVLAAWGGYDRGTDADSDQRLEGLARDVVTALTIRPASYDVMVRGGTSPTERLKMRGRFAVRFGDDRSEDGSEQRAKSVTTAFNSPFWPFVLTTTSVGQEGLDFHLYCHSVVHWNLPHNPVDLEQREGRVHRYMGHAIRKNVAASTATAPETQRSREPWRTMFEVAARTNPTPDDLVPYWVYAPTSANGAATARIERRMSIIPFTREASRLPDLLRTTAHYRMAFGQPRQDELLELVLSGVSADDAERLKSIRVDLTPPDIA